VPQRGPESERVQSAISRPLAFPSRDAEEQDYPISPLSREAKGTYTDPILRGIGESLKGVLRDEQASAKISEAFAPFSDGPDRTVEVSSNRGPRAR